MKNLGKAIVFTVGQAFAFNVVLPIWYVLEQLKK